MTYTTISALCGGAFVLLFVTIVCLVRKEWHR